MTMSTLLNSEEQLKNTPELPQPSATVHDNITRRKNDKVGRLQRIRRRISASLGRLTVIKDEPTQELLASEGSLYDCQARSIHQHINPGLESRSLTCLVNLQENEVGNDFMTRSEVQHSPLETHVYQAKASHFMPSLKRYWSVNDDITQVPKGDAAHFKPRLHRPFSECTFEGTLKRYSSVDSPFGKVESYKKLERLGEGSYATVYKGMSSMNKQIVALKEIRLQEEEGAPFTAIREASLLKGLKHANIVTLIDILHTKETLTFVFEYVSTDLSQYLEKYPGGLNPHNVKLFLYQLLRGLDFCHQRRILHRDIKPQNLLISNIGELKLADFGLARAKSVPSRTYSHEVVTLWYRPPDVLLGSTKYSTSLDMWGVGCIFMEMLSGQAIFPGMKDIYDQLNKIFRILGTPTEDSWEGVSSYPNYSVDKFNRHRSRRLIQVYPKLLDVPHAENLAASFLQLDPKKRVSAKDAKFCQYFSDLPGKVHDLPPAASVFVLPGVKLIPESSHKMTARSATKVLL